MTGFLEDGVSSCTRLDAQGKAVGEYLASHTSAHTPLTCSPGRDSDRDVSQPGGESPEGTTRVGLVAWPETSTVSRQPV